MKLYKVKLISATSERWVTVRANSESMARSMVFTNRTWGIGDVVPPQEDV